MNHHKAIIIIMIDISLFFYFDIPISKEIYVVVGLAMKLISLHMPSEEPLVCATLYSIHRRSTLYIVVHDEPKEMDYAFTV